jgi:hypothetical protein
VLDRKADAYVITLPEVETSRLLKGALFFAQGRIFQVIETNPGGYHRAREWRMTETTDVALIPGSFLSKYLPLIQTGRLLPAYRSRTELSDEGRTTCYVFPNEDLARDSAYFDVALIQSPGAYVRRQEHEPAFAATDGVHVFRLYFYRETQHGRRADLSMLQKRPLPYMPRAHTDGPGYWRLLSTWTESLPDIDMTQPMRAIRLDETLNALPVDVDPTES